MGTCHGVPRVSAHLQANAYLEHPCRVVMDGLHGMGSLGKAHDRIQDAKGAQGAAAKQVRAGILRPGFVPERVHRSGLPQ